MKSPATIMPARLRNCRASVTSLVGSKRHGGHARGVAATTAANSTHSTTKQCATCASTAFITPGMQCRRAVAVAAAGTSSGGSSHGSPSQSLPPPLEDWLQSQGGTVNGVELRSVLFPSGSVDRQLRATCDHPAGALLISVPRALQIRYDNIEEAAATAATSDTAATAATGDALAGKPGECDAANAHEIPAADAAAVTTLYGMMPRGSDTGGSAWPFKQALTLLYHLSRGSASPLLPYIAHLPGLAPGVPTPRVAMLMHDDVVEELQYGIIIQDVRNHKYWLRHVTREVLGRPPPDGAATVTLTAPTVAAGESSAAAEPLAAAGPAAAGSGSASAAAAAFGGLEVDEELFGWAAAVAMSRCFGLSRFRTHTCVPLVDMANHVAPYSASNCEIRTGLEGQVAMYAKRQILAGEELTLTYGTHDNHNLLLSYGFTLQPNPNDAFYFDIDLTTLESLVEGLTGASAGGGGGGGGVLAPWQLRLLASKMGLRRPDEGKAAGDSSGTIRVYLSAAAPSGGTAEGADADDGDGDAPAAGAATAAAATGRLVIRQPVDPRLLAALRIATLQDEAWFRELSTLTADQIGGWENLLARQQEVTVMRLLAALVTALYTTFPTTIQQDRQLLASASLDVAAASAAVTLSPAAVVRPETGTVVGCDSAGGHRGWAMRPSHFLAAASGSSPGSEPGAAAVATHARDVAAVIGFRLGLKTSLERCLQVLVARAKELDALPSMR